ncbi:hypothetical protein [Maribellus mangrovi]|uniref:hypothetical protein n=1 Tax=Maribellus mangrovi TaxID=3133146 RepID=UPI0030ED58EB
MKTFSKLLFVVFSVLIVMACSKSSDDLLNVDLKSGNLGADKIHETKTVTVPFKADFTVWHAAPTGSGEPCDMPNAIFRETMKGSGEITHLGEITTWMTFCVFSDFSYAFTELGYFVAANGDSLFINIPEGQIIPGGSDLEGYSGYFNDTMYFAGGTGRFEGASGYALTNAYPVFDNSETEEDEFFTDFFSEGILTLVKGK